MSQSINYSSFLLVIVVLLCFTCDSKQFTSAASSNIRPNENSHRIRPRPAYFKLSQHPLNSYSRLKTDDLIDDDDFFELNKRQTSDDYGHLRFGKRDEFDDYGHMRFGRSGPEVTN